MRQREHGKSPSSYVGELFPWVEGDKHAESMRPSRQRLHTGRFTGIPALYVRYVDDIFCIFREGDTHHDFLTRLNTLHPSLAFTVEVSGKTMPFLDMQVTLDSER